MMVMADLGPPHAAEKLLRAVRVEAAPEAVGSAVVDPVRPLGCTSFARRRLRSVMMPFPNTSFAATLCRTGSAMSDPAIIG